MGFLGLWVRRLQNVPVSVLFQQRATIVYVSAFETAPEESCSGTFGTLNFLKYTNFTTVEPAVLCRLAKRLSKEGLEAPEIWKDIEKRTIQIAPFVSFDELTLLLQSFSISRQPQFSVFSVLSARALALLTDPATERRTHENQIVNDIVDATKEDQATHQADSHATRSRVTTEQLLRFVKSAAALNLSDSRVLNLLANEAFHHVKKLSPADLAELVISYAKLNHCHQDLFALAAHGLSPYVATLSSHHIAALLWAFSRVSIFHPAIVHALCHETLIRDNLSLKNTMTILAALGRLARKVPGILAGTRYEQLLKNTLLQKLRQSGMQLNLQDILQVLEALINLEFWDPEFVSECLFASLRLHIYNMEHAQATDSNQFHVQRIKDYSHLLEMIARFPKSFLATSKTLYPVLVVQLSQSLSQRSVRQPRANFFFGLKEGARLLRALLVGNYSSFKLCSQFFFNPELLALVQRCRLVCSSSHMHFKLEALTADACIAIFQHLVPLLDRTRGTSVAPEIRAILTRAQRWAVNTIAASKPAAPPLALERLTDELDKALSRHASSTPVRNAPKKSKYPSTIHHSALTASSIPPDEILCSTLPTALQDTQWADVASDATSPS